MDIRKLLASAGAGLLVVAGAGATTATAGPRPVPAGIAWGACDDDELAEAGAECGRLSVPLDYGRPQGQKITLAISRVRHTSADSNYQGVVLVNPGGPGGSGLSLATLGAEVPGDTAAEYDWIGFDPRGVGASSPALTCDPAVTAYNRPFYVPQTPALEQIWLGRSRDYARKCARNGALLSHMTSLDQARDMDGIRQALGARQINFYGFSYGTYLGQIYATVFPGNVRRMVFDSSVDPTRVWYQANLDQDPAFDRNARIFFDWVAKNDEAYHLGASGEAVARKYYVELETLRQTPAGGVIGPDELSDVMLDVGYGVLGWTQDAAALAALINDDDHGPVKALYDDTYPQGPGSDNGTAAYLATECTDARWPQNWQQWKTDNSRIHARAPFETWGNAWLNAPCLTWSVPATNTVGIDGSRAPAVLLIGETLDAATPFSGNLEVRRRFPRAALVEGLGGTTHAASLRGVACVDNTVAAYLDTGALPPRLPGNRSDKKCEPLAQPAPAALLAARPSAPSTGTGRIPGRR